MTQRRRKNKYFTRSHISEGVFRRIVKDFAADVTAEMTASHAGLERKTVNRLFMRFRCRLKDLCEDEDPLTGEVEVDESYFGPRRVRGKRGRGARGKIPVVGLLRRGGHVYTHVVLNCERKQLMPIIQGKVLSGSTIHTDGWTSYDGLVLRGYRHYRIHHHENEFARGKNHINGIESFWSYAKRRLLKFNGTRKQYFVLHLKESEFRWNHRGQNLYQFLLENFRRNPL